MWTKLLLVPRKISSNSSKLLFWFILVLRNLLLWLQLSLKLLSAFVLPCFLADSVYKIWWFVSGGTDTPYFVNLYASDVVSCTLQLFSWLYRTSIFILVCILFRLICYLQILRLEDFSQVFEKESDVGSILIEHLTIRRNLRIISHRFRVFVLLALVLVTISQLASLVVTTKSGDVVNIYTAGELAVSPRFLSFQWFDIVNCSVSNKKE